MKNLFLVSLIYERDALDNLFKKKIQFCKPLFEYIDC